MLSVELSALLLGALLLLVVPLNWLSAAIFAAAVHELAHIAMILLCGGRIYGLRIGAAGARLDVEDLGPFREGLSAAAGPLGSFLLLLAAGIARSTGLSGQQTVIKLAALTIAGALGGVLGVGRRRR